MIKTKLIYEIIKMRFYRAIDETKEFCFRLLIRAFR